MIKEINWEELEKPFTYDQLDWIVTIAMELEDGHHLQIAPYVTNRAVQDRLDSVCGKDSWSNTYTETSEGLLCSLSIKVDGEWVTKTDGAEKKGLTPLKTACSVAMKRAAVQFGIGRYLYYLPRMYAAIQQGKRREYYRYQLKNKNYVYYLPDAKSIEIVKKANGEIE